ncbi:MAG: sugar ABC transporter permease [Chloroflexi bacterium]|uniref:Sugar ABC transporter permease n=1 Tax=Candidatus Chlorohelix allophototropha TaxID=3003348 RepID=A0A8T7LUN2_9CHLR|nr:sugar ABC transporter permease [Chloroflexota bacterium]WJW67593.1 sugar ABC transporter permease [Chloroflexota bacterium L227-S17]
MSIKQDNSTEVHGKGTVANANGEPVMIVPERTPEEKRNMARNRRIEFAWAMLYMLPALIIFIAFTYVPFFRAIYLSFFITDARGDPVKFNDVKYYSRILNLDDSGRSEYLRSIWTTIVFTIMVVPFGVVASLALAVLATAKVRIIGVFRTIFTSSVAISVASAAVIWSLIYSPNVKVTQWLIDFLQIKSTTLLNDALTALPAVAFMTIWSSLGFNFIITLSGIQAIPQDLYESGLIDGASGWKAFRFITLPLLTPTLLFLFVISVISSFQAFTQFNVLVGNEGPDGTTNVLVYTIFTAFWKDNRYGFASALSVVLFVVLLVLTFIQFKSLDRKVHYQ